ncbi:MAG: hypothetical protein ACK5MY_02485 [Jhaorihella sp.]
MSQDLLERFYSTTIFGSISSTQYLGDLAGRGDQIIFFKKPQVSARRHVKDGTIKHDTLETDSHTMIIDQACEWSVKMAQVDERMMGMWPTFKAAMMDAASEAMQQIQDQYILSQLHVDVADANQGDAAGCISGCYDLGTVGAPIEISSGAQWVRLLARLSAVLSEANMPRENRYVVAPPIAEYALMTSPFMAMIGGNGGFSSAQMLNGQLPGQVMGFTHYISHNLTSVVDPVTNQQAWYIVAGLPMATAYASVLEQTRTIDQDPDSWDTFYQGLLVYGFDVLYPQGLAVAYVTFDCDMEPECCVPMPGTGTAP